MNRPKFIETNNTANKVTTPINKSVVSPFIRDMEREEEISVISINTISNAHLMYNLFI